MTSNDLAFFDLCWQLGLVHTPFLEVGSARVQGNKIPNLCDVYRSRGGAAIGCDIQQGDGVDIVFDFALPAQQFQQEWRYGTFSTIAIFNVLEHTFDPIGVLQNACGLLRPDGSLLVVTPAIWNLHNFPRDYVRLLPDWYREFARRFGLFIHPQAFCWLSEFGITPIKDLEGTFPNFLTLGSPLRYWISRVVHKLFNTYGRSHTLTNVAIGVAFVNRCMDTEI